MPIGPLGTRIHTHVLNRGPAGVRSPADRVLLPPALPTRPPSNPDPSPSFSGAARHFRPAGEPLAGATQQATPALHDSMLLNYG